MSWPISLRVDDPVEPLRIVYRVVRSSPPTARDFASPAALGRRFRDSRQSDLARGVSVFRTQAQALRHARRYDLGTFIAELRLPAGTAVRRTLRRSVGHHTVFAEAEVLLASVVRIALVD